MQQLAHWWNRRYGGMVRRDIWVDRLVDGRFDVHWRGGEWRDRDGHFRTRDRRTAWWAVRQLLAGGEDWLRVDLIGKSPPREPESVAPERADNCHNRRSAL